MNKHTFYTRLLTAVERYTEGMDAADLVRFNDCFDPITSVAAVALQKPYITRAIPAVRLSRALRRAGEVKTRTVARKAARTAAKATA